MLFRRLAMVPFAGQLIRVSWKLFWDGRVPLRLKALPLLAAVYIISPFDPVPDFLLGLGQIDDIIVTGMLLLLFVLFSPRHLVSEHLRGRPATPDNGGKTVDGTFRYVEPE